MLNKLRKKIDEIDKNISDQLAKRYEVIEEITKEKQKLNLPIYNKNREEEHLNDIISKNKFNKNCRAYIAKIFKEIFRISRSVQ